MTNKTAAEWMKESLAKYKDTFEFKLEEVILDITEEVCRAMEEKEIDRAELADKLGVSRAFISKLLNGTPNLTIKTLMKIAVALDKELSIRMPPVGFTTHHLYVPIEGRSFEYKLARPEEKVPWKFTKAVNDIYSIDEGLKNVG